MAGESLTYENQRAIPVRPDNSKQDKQFLPIIEEFGGEDVEEKTEDTNEQWREVAEKVEDITKRMAEYLDDDNGKEARQPPMVRTLARPTKEEYERHQLTHTPYASWCKHCAMARVVRTNHPTKGRATVIVLDVERGIEGPTKLSMDYMYLHERADDKRGERTNPPYLVVIEHKHGRVWTYQVPNKGVMGGAHWLPKRFVSDWDNNGMKNVVIQLKSDQEPSIVNIQSAVQEARERERERET